MPIQAIEAQRLYQHIAQQLRQLIGAGEFLPGSRLPAERELASQLGVSRPSVREALIALEVEGWVEVRGGSGVYVLSAQPQRLAAGGRAGDETRSGTNTPNEQDGPWASGQPWGPLEVLRARRAIEGEIAALAAQACQAQHLQALQQALAAMEQAAQAGQAPLQADRAFHLSLAAACGNPVLADIVLPLWDARRDPLFARLSDYFETPASWRSAIDEHRRMLQALQAGDPHAARLAMHQHLDCAHERFNAAWPQAAKP